MPSSACKKKKQPARFVVAGGSGKGGVCKSTVSLHIVLFFFNDTATTEIYTLSLHDALPIYVAGYRTPMLELAGQKADGYIARPAESIPGLRYLLRKMKRAAKAAGRDPEAIDVTGYLL